MYKGLFLSVLGFKLVVVFILAYINNVILGSPEWVSVEKRTNELTFG